MTNERTADGDILIPPVECSEEGCTRPDREKCKDCRYRWEPWFAMNIKTKGMSTEADSPSAGDSLS